MIIYNYIYIFLEIIIFLGHFLRLTKNRLGEYYLCVTVRLVTESENQAPIETLDSTVALDPGVRTAYSTDGDVVEWG